MSISDDIRFEQNQLMSLWRERDQYPQNSSSWNSAEERCMAQLRRLDAAYEREGLEPPSKEDLQSLYLSA